MGGVGSKAWKGKAPSRTRRGRFVRPYPIGGRTAESEGEMSDGSMLSTASVTSVPKRTKRKSLPVDAETASKFMAIPTSESDTGKSVAESTAKTKTNLPNPEELVCEMQSCANAQLGERVEQHIQLIEEVADRSRNLKGTFAHGLRVAALNLKAALGELSRRSDAESNMERLERENAELRSQISIMSYKLDKLTDEINILRVNPTTTSRPETTADVSQKWCPAALDSRGSEDGLMERIGVLIESKFAAFEANLFPDRAIRPLRGANKNFVGTQRQEADTLILQEQRTDSAGSDLPKQSRRRRKKRPPHPSVADLPPIALPQTQAVRHMTEPTWVSITKKPKPKTLSANPGISGYRKKGLRVPTTAAVSITIPENSTVTYAKVMEIAKNKISLADIGIDTLRQKRAMTGGLLLEIIGPECNQKADNLAAKLREALSHLNLKIRRPTKTGDIRLRDLDDAVNAQEVAEAVAKVGGCSADEIKVGEIHRSLSSMGSCWLRCPIKVVRNLVVSGFVRVGWSSVRVEAIEPRPLHCFRCLEKGHVGSKCPNQVFRGSRCYACGEDGHRAKECTSPTLKCPLCSDLGKTRQDRRQILRLCRRNGPYFQCVDARPGLGSGGYGSLKFEFLKVLQGNLNHCRNAQQLLMQTIAEQQVALSVLAEPYTVPDHPQWFGDLTCSVAIHWSGRERVPMCSLLHKGTGLLAIRWGALAIVGCYISPNKSLSEYKAYLDTLAACVRDCHPLPVIVLGDFNAHARAWGNPRDKPKGRTLLDWSAELDLRLLNQGS
ncbi:PREDICTED: uncharacterized protein LOC106106084, partial [Papilio polytes]|uniref:uncharacterized protein LOC106106084 n=1 Tax=Papilio polytes TaxID=76194 RepID=UPI0006766C5E